MKKYFTKKKIVILILATIITIIAAVIVGVKVSSTKKVKEKLAQKAQVEDLVKERKDVAGKIKDSKSGEEKTEEDNYSEEYKEYENLSDEEKAKVEVVPRKEKVDYSELKNIKEYQKKELGKEYVSKEKKKEDKLEGNKEDKPEDKKDDSKEDKPEDDDKEVELLPEKFNLKDKITITVENQQQFGLCWDYTSVKSLETNLALTQNKNYDFSESHIDYMTSNLLTSMIRNENCGGNFEDMIEYNNFYKGFVLEDEVPLNVYEDYEYNTFYNTQKESIYITKCADFPRLYKYEDTSEEEFEMMKRDFQNVVKTHIMNYGSIYAVIDAPDYGYNHYVKDYADVEDGRGSHAVSIVGWDDNYSKDNFISPKGNKPEKDGAYIALNSWGEYWGEGGYFYISYEDRMVHSQMSGILSVNKKSDLLKLSTLSNVARKYISDNYIDMIINIEGEDYIKEDFLKTYCLDLSSMNIDNINDVGVLLSISKGSINLSNNNLESIEGIDQYIKSDNVSIDFSNNKIKDVSPLKNLQISSLILDGNYGVTGYELIKINFSLSLEGCGITKLSDITNIENIETLNLSNNIIDDYSDICKLTNLYELDCRNCELESLDKLKDVFKMENMCYIDLSHNNIKDISGMDGTLIKGINLSYNTEISNFEPLRKASRIVTVELTGCNIKNAQDVLIESVMDDYLDEIKEYEYDESDMEEYYGVYYGLSNNKEIYNLKSLKNASGLNLEDCNLSDISELKELEYLSSINLSNNHGVKGDLSGKEYSYIYLNNCGLDDDFDLFNVNQVEEIEIRKNNIKNIDKLKDKVMFSIVTDYYDGEIDNEDGPWISVDNGYEVVEEVIEIPNQDGLEMNVTSYMKSKHGLNLEINGKKYSSKAVIVPINKNSKISYEAYYPSHKKVTITFRVNKNLKNEGIVVVKNSNCYNAKNNEELDTTAIKVANVYGNYITKITEDFSIENEIHTLPEKLVERDYDINEKSHIFVPQKYYCQVVQDNLSAKFAVSAKAGEILLDEDLTPPEDFKEEFPTLTFKTDEMYNIAKEYWKDHIVSCDDEFRTIILKEYREENGSDVPMYIPRRLLSDIGGLKPMILTDIYILFNDEDGNELITEEELKYFEEFPDLSHIHIITLEENVDNLIVKQDKYVVDIENGVG